MLKRIQNPRSALYNYFKEADNDEGSISVTVAQRKNRGTDYSDDSVADNVRDVKVTPRKNRGTDYSQISDAEERDITVDDSSDGETETDYTSDDSVDTSDDTDTTDDTTTDDSETSDDSNNDESETDDSETSDDSGNNEDSGNDESETDEGETGDESGDDETATDYNSEAETEEEGNENTEDDSSSSEEDNNSSDDSGDEKRKKYNMYSRFLELYDTINSILEKVKSMAMSDVNANAVIKVVTSNLQTLQGNMYDYMVIKYKTASYMEILIYFEMAINCVKLNFELMRNNKINLKQ